jgi:mannosyl-oligosaccharide glucosidase
MIGGLGHFYGSSLIERDPKAGPQATAPYELLCSVPSRAFFPRGFLWDEGFHQLLISEWWPSLSHDILRSWLGLVEESGWLAREQILGSEARRRVPAEFQVQRPFVANPPTFLLAINKMLRQIQGKELHLQERLVNAEIDAATGDTIQTNVNAATSSSVLAQERSRFASFLRAAYPALDRQIRWFFKTQVTSLFYHI